MIKKIKYVLLTLVLLTSIGNLAIILLNSKDVIDILKPIITASFLTLFSIIFIISSLFVNKKKGNIYILICFILLICFNSFNILTTTNIISLPKQTTINDFTNSTISEALIWAKENKIEVEQVYENSDTIEEYKIISQNIQTGTLTKNIEKIIFTISSGPNYDKNTIVSNMLGWTIDDTLKYIKKNFLNNIKILYVESNEKKDTIIKQDKYGTLKRNEEITLTFSLGSETLPKDINIKDLTNKSLFEAEIYLKRNKINYEIKKEFNSLVERNYIISQNKKENETFNLENDKLELTISKGKEIIVPNLLNMKSEDIIAWIIDNNLKINFKDSYDEKIELGNLINANYNHNDTIEEETLIEITISKGPLRMNEFNSLSEFRNWASKYNIKYTESYEFSQSIVSGKIISFSHSKDQIIKNEDTIKVIVSQGKEITIPNYIGKSRTYIQNSCNNLGLNCSFSYGNYSSTPKGYATYQNKRSGSKVISGTYLRISLSSGPAKSYKLIMLQSDLSIGSATGTINSLKTKFAREYSGVKFSFITKESNTYSMPGYIHENSPVKSGISITQGKTYTIWITK